MFATLSRCSVKALSELVSIPIQTGHTPSMKNPYYYYGDIKFIKTDNLRKNDIREPFTDNLSNLGNESIKRTQLKEGDIITTIIGATYDIIARSCIVTKDLLPANINQNIVRIRTKDIPSGYICCYLNSSYGRMNLEYLARQMEQVNLNCEEVGQVLIPLFDDEFHNTINKTYLNATNKRVESRRKYKDAADVLSEMFMKSNYEISEVNTAIIPFSKSYNYSRIDSEYYLPQYENYIDIIKKACMDWDIISNLCEIVDDNFKPEDKTIYKYVELSNIGSFGDITGCTIAEGWELPSRARRKIAKGDVIVSSVEGSLDCCAIVTDEYDGALCSNGFYVVRSTNITPESLLLLFKSIPVQKLLKKGCSGTILSAISREEFDKIPLPIIDKDIQNILTDYITQSIMLREESITILNEAEKAIVNKIEGTGVDSMNATGTGK